MNATDRFKAKSKELQKGVKELYNLLSVIKEEIIKHDLLAELPDTQTLKSGINRLNYDWIEEVIINGEVFTLINRANQKYKGYVVYTEKEYNTIGLGFLYKNDIVSPHIDFAVENIINKYNDEELLEISAIIDDKILKIQADINYLKCNKDVELHKHYYRNYDSGFEGKQKFSNISEVLNDFKK